MNRRADPQSLGVRGKGERAKAKGQTLKAEGWDRIVAGQNHSIPAVRTGENTYSPMGKRRRRSPLRPPNSAACLSPHGGQAALP